MKIYYEETMSGSQGKEVILIMDIKEASELLAMTQVASKSNKRKLRWKRLLKIFEERLPLY